MNKTTEALKHLEAYRKGYEHGRFVEKMDTALAEPVKQEPVEWFHKIGCKANAFGECDMGCRPPVDAKAIRAEALEEAAKWFEDEEHPLQPKKVAAAIRGLK